MNEYVTICLPVFNGENFIQKKIENILSQSYKKINVIISDNNSSDGTLKIAENFGKDNNNIFIIKQEDNIGIYKNFTYLYKMVDTDLFIWTAVDDIWDQDWIETLVNNRHVNDVITCGETFVLSINKKFRAHFTSYCGSDRFLKYTNDIFNRDYKAMFMYGLINKAKIKDKIFEFPENDFGPDLLFIARCLKYGDLRKIDNSNMYYLRHEKQYSHIMTKNRKSIKQILSAIPLGFLLSLIENYPTNAKMILIFILLKRWFYYQIFFLRRAITRRINLFVNE